MAGTDSTSVGWRGLVPLAGVAAAYYAAGRLGLAAPAFGNHVTLIWLPTGIAVAGLVRFGPRLWPAIGIPALLLSLHAGATPLAALAIAAGNTIGPLLTERLLRRMRFEPTFQRLRDVAAFCGTALAGMLLPASTGVGALVAAGAVESRDWLAAWSTWYLGDTMGLLLAGPALVSVRAGAVAAVGARQAALAMLCMLVAMVAIAWPLGGSLGHSAALLLLLPLVAVAWTALRFGAAASSFCSLGIALLVAGLDLTGHPPFRATDTLATPGTFWTYVAMLSVLGLMLAALRAELGDASRAADASHRRYEELFGMVPLPLAVMDRETGRFLAVNDATVAAYGYSRDQFLRMESRDIAVDADVEPFSLFDRADPLVGRHRRHRLRDGSIIAVEMSGHAVDFDGRAAVLTVARDVSEQQRVDREVLEAGLRERRRLSEELHDGLGQDITGLSLLASALAAQSRRGGLAVAPEIERLAELARQAVSTCRDVARGLSPLSEMHGGLGQALADMVERLRSPGGPAIELALRGEAESLARLPAEIKDHAYRIAQEALTNALKHARSSLVGIECCSDGAGLRLVVRDDGIGLPPGTRDRDGLGIRIMRHRAATSGGRLSIEALPGGGTRVGCEWSPAATVAARTGEPQAAPGTATRRREPA